MKAVRTRRAAMLVLAAAMASGCAHRDPALDVLARAQEAMGGDRLRSLRFTADGLVGTFGQSYQAGTAWPRARLTGFTGWMDYEAAAMEEDAAQQSRWRLKGDVTWEAGDAVTGPTPAAVRRRHDLWTSPHGVLKAAMRNKPSLRVDGDHRIVSFSEPGVLRASVWIGRDDRVERVESVFPDPLWGDVPATTLYSGYKAFGPVQFPMQIRRYVGGFVERELQVKAVDTNASAKAALDAAPATPLAPHAQLVDGGVWLVAGASYHSVLVELADEVLLVEAPLDASRTTAVIDEARKVVPNKTVRHVVATHHHPAAAGGVRAAAAQGAEVLVAESSRPWFEKMLAQPAGPMAAKARVMGVDGQLALPDATRRVDLFVMDDSPEAAGLLLVWLPRERVLVEAATSGIPAKRAGQESDVRLVNLLANLERLQLDPLRILPLRGQPYSLAELRAAVRRPE